jgi:hypothetical protein
MARRSKHEYLYVMWQRDQAAGRRQFTALLDEVTRICGYPRKYAIALLNRPRPSMPRRRLTYSEEMIRVLSQIWEGLGYLCAARLKAALPHWLP